MRTKPLTHEEVGEIIDKQFAINGYTETIDTVLSAKFDEPWYQHYTTTEEKEQEFISWLEKYLSHRKFNKKQVKDLIGWLILMWGLKKV